MHSMKVWIYNIFTTVQMWCKCVSKYCICDINTVVNIKLSFTIARKCHTYGEMPGQKELIIVAVCTFADTPI